MKNTDINLLDLHRIIVGELPPEFFIEVIIRLIFTYLLALGAVRLMGKRMAAHLSRNELSALVSISAAIGVSVQSPDRGLLPSVVIVIVIVSIGRLIAWRAARNRKFEMLSQGHSSTLIKSGEMQPEEMSRNKIGREKILAQLRSYGITSLGQVERLYFEAGGQFSLVKTVDAKPGLSIIPEWDEDFIREQNLHEHLQACINCGHIRQQQETADCVNCGRKNWRRAVVDKLDH